MNELNKLIEQYGKETGYKAEIELPFEPFAKIWTNDFVSWLASRPTCGKEQRLFLDEVEKLAVNESNAYHPILLDDFHSVLFTSDFESDIGKVIKGE